MLRGCRAWRATFFSPTISLYEASQGQYERFKKLFFENPEQIFLYWKIHVLAKSDQEVIKMVLVRV